MKRTHLLALIVALLTSIAFATPDRPDAKKIPRPEFRYPDLAGAANPSVWGKLHFDRQSGALVIEGHPHWDATGQIRPDGKMQLLWTTKDGRPAPGVYEIGKDGILSGQWGYAEDVDIDDGGAITGSTHRDVIRKVER